MEKKPLSSPAAPRQYKKFNFEDLDEPLAGLLPEEQQDTPKKPAPTGTKSGSEKKSERDKDKESSPPQRPLHTVAPVQRRAEITFEDDGDNLIDSLGLGGGDVEELRPARCKLDELLGRSSVAKVLEEPGMGERREFTLDRKYQEQPEKEEGWEQEDFVLGAYQPTVAPMPKGQPSRRHSVSRFSAENSSEPQPEPHSKPPPAHQSPVRRSRAGGDWLGLKDEDFLDSEPSSAVKASPVESQPSPAAARRPRPVSQLPAAEEAAAKPSLPEAEDWLSAALSRKKAQAQVKAQERDGKPSEAPGGGLDCSSPVSQPAASPGAPQQAAVLLDKAASTGGSRRPLPWLSTGKQASAHPLEAAKGDPSRDTGAMVPTALFSGGQEMQGPAPLAQVTAPRAHLQAAPQLQAESSALDLLPGRRTPVAQLFEDASDCRAALLRSQARVAELESQVRTLEVERTQLKLLLESRQQWHQQNLDLLETTLRSQLKMVEESYGQREEKLRQEKEQLAAQLLSQSQDAEQARAELVAQHQQRLTALEQQNTLELERVRELQRLSVQEMRKDHEDQLQWLKRMKDQEIDAVTSATSHTRSLNNVIEQMEKLSSNMHELSHKIEATHSTVSQELVVEAQQRDKCLKVFQDRLSQQQSQLQEVIAAMEARLGEQTRLLEQKTAAEQSTAESLQHQLSVERAELEKAKSALLEEQQSVMQMCSEERRKLAAEWAEFRTQQQLFKEQMECDRNRALRLESEREGTIKSLAKEQAELKKRARELKAREEQLARDRELLDEAWRELRLEKQKVNEAALRVRQREEEVKSVSKLSSQQHEEGERALREARRIEADHQSRLRFIQQRLERAQQQEEQLHQERLSLACQRRQLEQLRQELPSHRVALGPSGPTAGLSPTRVPPAAAAPPGQALLHDVPPAVRLLPQPSTEGGRGTLDVASAAQLYTTVLLLKHRAQQDHDFLKNEEIFLENLKKESYNTSFLLG